MEWKVVNAVSRDTERQQLNKILKEIRNRVTEVEEGAEDTASTITKLAKTISSLSSSSTTYVKKVVLTGDVVGTSSTVTADGTLSITTEVKAIANTIDEAPNDGSAYWRVAEQWEAVPDNVYSLQWMEASGYMSWDDENGEWNVRTFTAGDGIVVTDGDGVADNTTISLEEVTTTSGGTLQLLAFDNYGRRVEEGNATTDDLEEGTTNLYFTEERAQDSVGSILTSSSDVELSYDDSTPSITALLTSAVHASLDLADSSVQPGDNVSTLTNDSGFLNYTTLKTSLVAGTNTAITPDDVAETLTITATGVVSTVTGGIGITVDNTDAENPVVALSAASQASLALADTAVQYADLATVATTGEISDLVGDSDDITEGTTNLFLTSAERTKLSGIEDGAEANVNADWNATSGEAEILNKPILGEMAAVDDAPSDGSVYGRKNGAWEEVTTISVALHLDFWLTDGNKSDILLTSNYELPFWLTSGTQSNIVMVT